MVLGACWLMSSAGAMAPACCALARTYMRTVSGISMSPPVRGSVWPREPWRCQYSVLVWVCITRGSVAGRLSTLSSLSEKESGTGE